MHLLFGFSGRIGRLQWWLGVLGNTLIWVALGFLFYASVAIWDFSSDHAAGELSDGALVLLFFLLTGLTLGVWTNAATTVKRFHDRGKSGFWFFIIFVPIIGPIWQFVECGFLEGTGGHNDYGPPPRGFDPDRLTREHLDGLQGGQAPQPAGGSLSMRRNDVAPRPPVAPAPVVARQAPAATSFGRRGI